MTGCKVVGVTLLAVERWPSHRFSLCHQHTLPMLLKRVVKGGYMAFLKLSVLGVRRRLAVNFFLQLRQH